MKKTAKWIETHRLTFGLANMRRTMLGYKNNAKKRGYKFDLTEEQFAKLTQQNCHYCGAKPDNISNRSDMYGEYVYSGLDRINNKKDYTIDNVVPCCKRCNKAKSNLTLQEFQDWIVRIYNRNNPTIG